MVARTHSHSDENNRPSEEKIRNLKRTVLEAYDISTDRVASALVKADLELLEEQMNVSLALITQASTLAWVLNDWSGIDESHKQNYLRNLT